MGEECVSDRPLLSQCGPTLSAAPSAPATPLLVVPTAMSQPGSVSMTPRGPGALDAALPRSNQMSTRGGQVEGGSKSATSAFEEPVAVGVTPALPAQAPIKQIPSPSRPCRKGNTSTARALSAVPHILDEQVV